jgi:TRAP-type C4-dicarboxylate transport system permease small subunit
MKFLKSLQAVIIKIECFSVIFLLLLMCILAFSQVVMRNLFNFSFVWADVVVRMSVLWIAILGASIATSERAHIHINFGTKPPPKPYDSYLEAFLTLLATTVCFFFSLVALEFVSVEIASETVVDALNAPEWVFTTIFPIGFIVMTFKFLLLFLGHISDAIKGPEGGEAE